MPPGSVTLESVSLAYRIRPRPVPVARRSLVESLRQRLGRRRRLLALRDVTFEVEPGETFGLIGANGSGKSTLLRLIAGVMEPSHGQIEVCGRVTALLELGTGFHLDLTGRENILLNGLVLGMSKAEIAGRLDEIIEFSGLQQFIDVPVRHYSAGMFMRLGFSVAAHADPDVFLIDEVLAVGDEAFQHRCFPRIQEFQRQNKTIVFASHHLPTLSALCRRGIWLHRGRVMAVGEMTEVVRQYQEAVEKGDGLRVES